VSRRSDVLLDLVASRLHDGKPVLRDTLITQIRRQGGSGQRELINAIKRLRDRGWMIHCKLGVVTYERRTRYVEVREALEQALVRFVVPLMARRIRGLRGEMIRAVGLYGEDPVTWNAFVNREVMGMFVPLCLVAGYTVETAVAITQLHPADEAQLRAELTS